jgi:hypothetical protein
MKFMIQKTHIYRIIGVGEDRYNYGNQIKIQWKYKIMISAKGKYNYQDYSFDAVVS